MKSPYFPIVYVRGYAMSTGERDETTADPFCGFNVGSTMYRASISKNEPPKKFIFESPLVRLLSDLNYCDVYENGSDIADDDWQPPPGRNGIPACSVIIYRYYDSGSTIFGDGEPEPIEEYARGLDKLVRRIRSLVCKHEGIAEAQFRCYLVAHSMGGLIARAFLQNPSLRSGDTHRHIDKLFTYGTPHNGIDAVGMNVPSFLTAAQVDTFNRKRMARYLNLEATYKTFGRVDYVPEDILPADRIFSMVGTNRNDYEAAQGLSRTFVGRGSDGLVRVDNASVWGLDARGRVTRSCSVAYAYRSHSGPYGIVNSEEAYQNLTRFLFGDVRVEIWVQVDEVRLPESLRDQQVDALYQFEFLARPRGKRWFLSRRVAEEDSPACRTYKQLTGQEPGARLVYLSTVHLANRAKVSQDDATLSYAMDVRIRVQDYEVDRRFWPNAHYEGSYVFRDSLTVVLTPPEANHGQWKVQCDWESEVGGTAVHEVDYTALASSMMRVEVPFFGPEKGASAAGKVLLIASPWN